MARIMLVVRLSVCDESQEAHSEEQEPDMKLVTKCLFWFGLYLFLVTCPMGVAAMTMPRSGSASLSVNLAIGLGFVALGIMALEMALVSRLDAASGAFGLDVLFQFHRGVGIASVALVVIHLLLLIGCGAYPVAVLGLGHGVPMSIRLGTLAAILAVVLVITSILRRRLGMRYEVWRILHGVLAMAIIVLAAIHVTGAGRFAQGLPMRIVGGLLLLVLVGIFLRYRLVRPMMLLGKPWEVMANLPERGGAHIIKVRPVGHSGFSFLPGQFAWINLGATPFHMEQHPISMSSCGDAPLNGEIAFTIRALGDWSGQGVPRLQPGQRVWIEGPYGSFSIDVEEGPGYVFIAGGVGITPFASMLETMAVREDHRPVVLFFGARAEGDLTLRAALESLAPKLNLKLVYVLEHPSPGWKGATGFINATVLRQNLPKNFQHFQILICGPAPLMDLMEKELPSLGIPADRIHAERFDLV
jgi:predicted ferric reductase